MDHRTRVASGQRGTNPGAGDGPVRFWIPASNYYLLVTFIAGGIFLIAWASLYDGYDDSFWIVAAISAAVFAASFVLFREVVLRRFRRRTLAARRLSHHLRTVGRGRREENSAAKITLERNQQVLDEIRTKSDAAKVLGRVAEAHKEVFDLCEQYLTAAASEISAARPGSPRIPALRKGSKFAMARHRFHMLKWAEIKARSFTAEVGGSGELTGKVHAAREALEAVDRAISVYPGESSLMDSRSVLRVFLVSARIKVWIDNAERASAEGSSEAAIGHYREALSDLQECEVEFPERDAIFERIQSEIGRIRKSADLT